MHHFADMAQWQGRIDAEEGLLGRRWHQVMRPVAAVDAPAVALIGFACDAGVARNHGRSGACDGPASLRAQLANQPVRDDTVLADAGDVRCIAGIESDGLEAAQRCLSHEVAALLAQAHRPIVLGGGHEMAWGSFGGMAQALSANAATAAAAPRIGIINLDAHFDLRTGAVATSGTPFRQIAEDCLARGWSFNYCCLGVSHFANTLALFERAEALGTTWLADEQMTPAHAAHIAATLHDFMARVDHLYLTICLDVLPAAVAPGVSAPAARGVELAVIEPIIDLVAASGKLRLADIAELNPRFDIDNRTARVGARLVARLAHAWSAA